MIGYLWLIGDLCFVVCFIMYWASRRDYRHLRLGPLPSDNQTKAVKRAYWQMRLFKWLSVVFFIVTMIGIVALL